MQRAIGAEQRNAGRGGTVRFVPHPHPNLHDSSSLVSPTAFPAKQSSAVPNTAV